MEGCGVLAGVLVRNREEGGDLKLAALNERVTRVFRIIGVDQFFSIYDPRRATFEGYEKRLRGRCAPGGV